MDAEHPMGSNPLADIRKMFLLFTKFPDSVAALIMDVGLNWKVSNSLFHRILRTFGSPSSILCLNIFTIVLMNTFSSRNWNTVLSSVAPLLMYNFTSDMLNEEMKELKLSQNDVHSRKSIFKFWICLWRWRVDRESVAFVMCRLVVALFGLQKIAAVHPCNCPLDQHSAVPGTSNTRHFETKNLWNIPNSQVYVPWLYFTHG